MTGGRGFSFGLHVGDRLPRDVVTDWNDGAVRCPWCSWPVEQVTVSLESLLYTFHHDALEHAPREADGTAGPDALTADCPECRRPFLIALQHRGPTGRSMRLLACRTEKDARLLAGAA